MSILRDCTLSKLSWEIGYSLPSQEVSLPDRLELGIAIPDSANPAENLQLRIIDHITNESGINPQLRVCLVNERSKIFGRLKYCSNLNEAIVYEKMRASNDPLTRFVPQYFGVLDSKGDVIDLRAEIEGNGEEAVRNKYKSAYIILGDLLKEVEGDGKELDGNAQDFKFTCPSLLVNQDEVAKHGHQHSSLYEWFRAKFLGMSHCFFAYQGNIKESWGLIDRVRRLVSISKTKNVLRRDFNRMESAALYETIRGLIRLKKAVLRSNFTSADSSLLLIPTKTTRNGRVEKSVEIRLIDFSYGMRRDENIAGFDQMKNAMAKSIEDLAELVCESYLSKT